MEVKLLLKDSVEALIERHCSHDYCVFALGFAPGYGFMGLVDEAIATPRLKTPRRRVAAGEPLQEIGMTTARGMDSGRQTTA